MREHAICSLIESLVTMFSSSVPLVPFIIKLLSGASLSVTLPIMMLITAKRRQVNAHFQTKQWVWLFSAAHAQVRTHLQRCVQKYQRWSRPAPGRTRCKDPTLGAKKPEEHTPCLVTQTSVRACPPPKVQVTKCGFYNYFIKLFHVLLKYSVSLRVMLTPIYWSRRKSSCYPSSYCFIKNQCWACAALKLTLSLLMSVKCASNFPWNPRIIMCISSFELVKVTCDILIVLNMFWH